MSNQSDNIIINFPTNIGDVILSLPALDKIRSNYPKAKITAIASPSTKEFFLKNNLIDEVLIFDKRARPIVKLKFTLKLRGKYKIMVDFKHSMLPLLLGIPVHTPSLRRFSNKVHIVDKYLKIIEKIAPKKANLKSDFILEDNSKSKWDDLNLKKAIFIACTSLSKIKQYPPQLIAEVIDLLANKYKIIILGMESERKFYKDILKKEGVVDLVGKTKMEDIFYLLKNFACLLLGVDSSITHMASYLDLSVVALFGPTSYERSYPRSKHSLALKREDLECVPCESGDCDKNIECMDINPQRVAAAIEEIIAEIKGHTPISTP